MPGPSPWPWPAGATLVAAGLAVAVADLLAGCAARARAHLRRTHRHRTSRPDRRGITLGTARRLPAAGRLLGPRHTRGGLLPRARRDGLGLAALAALGLVPV